MASSSQFIFDGELQNLRLRKGDLNNSKGEIGTQLGTKFDLNNGAIIRHYAKIAVEREFIKSNTVTINQINDFNNNFSGSIGK